MLDKRLFFITFVNKYLNLTASVTHNTPSPNDRTIGSTGYLSCSYTPADFVWATVRWDYKQSPTDTATPLYSYDVYGDVNLEPPDKRFNHTHTNGRFTLIIYNLTASDGGIYICNIDTEKDDLPFTPVCKLILLLVNFFYSHDKWVSMLTYLNIIL